MKKVLLALSVALVSALSFSSCSKGDYSSGDAQTGFNRFNEKNNQPKIVPTGTFTAKINGSDYKAAYSNAYFTSVFVGGSTSDSWVITGFKTDFTSADGFAIFMAKADVGTYAVDMFGGTGENSITYTPNKGASVVIANTGTIEILEKTDTRLKGKFTMQVSGFDVTEGTFDVPIIKYSDYYSK